MDGADLSSNAVALSNVIHVKAVAEHAVHQLKGLLGDAVRCVDLLVSDMNVTPFTLIDVLKLYSPFLKPGGRLIATLKFIGTRNDRHNQLRQLEEILQKGSWQCVQTLWLMANTKSERMVTAVQRL